MVHNVLKNTKDGRSSGRCQLIRGFLCRQNTYLQDQQIKFIITVQCGIVITPVPSIKVCLTSTMESTSFLLYQSGSYMSAKHACTFLEDSCIADDSDTRFISSECEMTSVDVCMCMAIFLCCQSGSVWILKPFTASRYALRSLWSLEPSAWGQKDGKRCLKPWRCDTILQTCTTYRQAGFIW